VARVLIENEPVCWSGAVKNDSQKGIVNGEMHNEREWDESSRRQLRRPIAANRFGTDCDKSSRDLFALTMKSGDSTENTRRSDIRNCSRLCRVDVQRNSCYVI
jgi:hypothetical protein